MRRTYIIEIEGNLATNELAERLRGLGEVRLLDVPACIREVCAALRADEFGGSYETALGIATLLEALIQAHIPLRAIRAQEEQGHA